MGYVPTFTYQAAVCHPPQFAPRDYRHFRVKPLTGAMGADVEGLDLASADDAAIEELQQALTDHIALMIRGQENLSPAAQIAFARRLGDVGIWPYAKPMEGYPEITELIQEPGDKYAFGGTWHSDSCSFERPPKYTILHCIECPPVGGDTGFANQYLAWETLDPALRADLEHRRAVASGQLGYMTAASDAEVQAHTATPVSFRPQDLLEVAHPVARTHPVTGRKALYVNSSYTLCFEGETQEQSLPLLRHLWEHAITPEFTCRLRWSRGALAIWDNRCCLHYAHSDYPGHRRHMLRIVVEGERPA